MKRIALIGLVAVATVLACTTSYAQLPGVRSVTLTNNNTDFYFFNEIDMFAGAVDVASTPNGATITATDNAVQWGSNEGAIDDVVNPACCDNTYHSDTAVGGQVLTIDFPSDVTLDSADIYGRLDACCPERTDDFTMEFFSGANGTGDSLLSIDVIGAGTDSLASYDGADVTTAAVRVPIPEPSSFLLGSVGMLLVFLRRRK